MPGRADWWDACLACVFNDPKVDQILRDHLDEAFHNEEFTIISIDGHFKTCLKIVGQANKLARKQIKEQMPISGADSLNTILTVRGRTGAPLAIEAMHDESAQDYSECLKRYPQQYLNSIQHVASDDPSAKLLDKLREITGNAELQLSLDPPHLAFAWDSCSMGTKRPPGSKDIRRVLAKFSQKLRPASSIASGYFEGRKTSRDENNDAVTIFSGMHISKAKKILDCLDPETGWTSRAEILESLAAVAKVYEETAKKKTTSGRHLRDILVSACAPGSILTFALIFATGRPPLDTKFKLFRKFLQ